jgi:hypothetical protein
MRISMRISVIIMCRCMCRFMGWGCPAAMATTMSVAIGTVAVAIVSTAHLCCILLDTSRLGHVIPAKLVQRRVCDFVQSPVKQHRQNKQLAGLRLCDNMHLQVKLMAVDLCL